MNEGKTNVLWKEDAWEAKWSKTNIIQQLKNEEIENIFAPLKNANANKKDFSLFLTEVVNHVFTLIKKDKVENEYIENKLGKLSAREILSDGKTCYMNPCLDFVLVTIEALKKSGISDTKLIVEELACPGNRYKIHFGIEIPHQGETYHIDYRSKNDVFLGKWKYQSDYTDKWEKIVNKINIDAKEIWTDDNIYSLIDKKVLNFKFFDPKILGMLKEKLKKDNTPEEYQNWFVAQVKDITRPEIFIENEK